MPPRQTPYIYPYRIDIGQTPATFQMKLNSGSNLSGKPWGLFITEKAGAETYVHYSDILQKEKLKVQLPATVVAHEMGHVLSLKHRDTPNDGFWYDGLALPKDRNVMDVAQEPKVNDNVIGPRPTMDLDILQLAAMRGNVNVLQSL